MLLIDPPLRLGQRVFGFWSLKGQPRGRYSGLPKPYIELVISLSGRHFWQEEKDAPYYSYEEGWLTPVQPGPSYAQTCGSLHLVGARLGIDTTATLFGCDVSSHGRHPIPLDALIGAEAALLREQLLACKSELERLACLAQWISNRLTESPILELPSLSYLAEKGWRTDALADLMGLSPRGLRKKFNSKLGIGPKFWLQLNRFDSLLRSDISSQGLAETAFAFGYTDQAHMTSDFKRFSGQSPQQYLLNRQANMAPREAAHFLPNAE